MTLPEIQDPEFSWDGLAVEEPDIFAIQRARELHSILSAATQLEWGLQVHPLGGILLNCLTDNSFQVTIWNCRDGAQPSVNICRYDDPHTYVKVYDLATVLKWLDL